MHVAVGSSSSPCVQPPQTACSRLIAYCHGSSYKSKIFFFCEGTKARSWQHRRSILPWVPLKLHSQGGNWQGQNTLRSSLWCTSTATVEVDIKYKWYNLTFYLDTMSLAKTLSCTSIRLSLPPLATILTRVKVTKDPKNWIVKGMAVTSANTRLFGQSKISQAPSYDVCLNNMAKPVKIGIRSSVKHMRFNQCLMWPSECRSHMIFPCHFVRLILTSSDQWAAICQWSGSTLSMYC